MIRCYRIGSNAFVRSSGQITNKNTKSQPISAAWTTRTARCAAYHPAKRLKKITATPHDDRKPRRALAKNHLESSHLLLLLLLCVLLLRMRSVYLGTPCPAPGPLSGSDATGGRPDAVLSTVFTARMSPPNVAAVSGSGRDRERGRCLVQQDTGVGCLFYFIDRNAKENKPAHGGPTVDTRTKHNSMRP